jgi:hypothetical protein
MARSTRRARSSNFTCREIAGKDMLVLEHAGFPEGQGEHLQAGWQANYWEPLAKYLAL